VGSTIAEKIFSARTGRAVTAGDIVIAPVDFVFSHDGNRPQPAEIFLRLGRDEVFDRSKVAMFLDHAPNAHTPATAEMHRIMQRFAADKGILIYPAGRGISHQVIPEEGHAGPGSIIVGSDSHTCTAGALNCLATGLGSTDIAVAMMLGKQWFKVPETIRVVIDGQLPSGVFSKDVVLSIIGRVGAEGASYKSIEYVGSTISSMSMEARMTITNMAVEMDAKFGLMECDSVTDEFLRARNCTEYERYFSDTDAVFAQTLEVNAAGLVPLIALPPRPDLVRPVTDMAGTPVHQATIGTSANGQLDDLRAAAAVLRGRRFAPGMKVFVTPASRRAYLAAQQEGLLSLFVEAGALIGTPGCSGCTGGSGFGIPADGENLITSANRNFVGRVGNNRANIFLASPATVMASAIEGVVADPRRYPATTATASMVPGN
jgi:3-isopropylmalate/(R)-2-methylmalate dehydratase large subunit